MPETAPQAVLPDGVESFLEVDEEHEGVFVFCPTPVENFAEREGIVHGRAMLAEASLCIS
jgi:hypothetical protein